MNSDEEADNLKIYELIKKGNPIAIGKIGANELNFLYMEMCEPNNKYLEEIFTHNVCVQAGVYPQEIAKNFMMNEYLNCLKDVDVMAIWNENKEFEKYLVSLKVPKVTRVTLRSLEPYYFDLQWTQLLKNKKVLIISPFTDSIKQQIPKKKQIWTNNLLPEFEPIFLKFPLSYYLLSYQERIKYPKDSQNLLKSYKDILSKIDYDFAIIGTGVYGLPLATFAKQMGKIGIHLGGPLQILFGIKGGRWDNYNFYNEYWIRPSGDEIPVNKIACENGCYW